MDLNKQFFHVSRIGSINGDIALSSEFLRFAVEKENPFFNDSEIVETMEKYFPNGISRHGVWYMSQKTIFFTSHENGQSFIPYEPSIEIIFELVRRANYPTLPSRFESFFAFEQLDEAIKFRSEKCNQGCPIYIVESEKFVRRDMSLLKFGFHNGVALTLAEKYWGGGQSSDPIWEMLLSFPIKIISQIALEV